MRKEQEAVWHTIIEIAGERLVAEKDNRGEIVKTWTAGEKSWKAIEASQNQSQEKKTIKEV